MNKVMITGGITRDCDLRFAASGTAVCRFSIANSVGFGENKKTYYFDIVIFGKTAENLSPYLVKGQKVAITGTLTTNSYEKDGVKKTKSEIIPDNYGGVELIGGKKADSQPSNNYDNDVFGGGSFNDDITPVDYEDCPF